MIWSPAQLSVAGLLLWLLVRFISPVEEQIALDFWAMAFVALCYLGFGIGAGLGRRASISDAGNIDVVDQHNARLIFVLLTATGLIGFFLRYIDRVFLRAVDYSLEAAAIREQLAAADATVLGIVGAVMLPACYLPAVILLASRRPGWWRHLFWALPLFLLPIVEALAQLSRSVFLIAAAFFFISLVAQRWEGNPFRMKLLLSATILLILLAAFSSIIFISRLEGAGMTFEHSILNSVYAQLIGPSTAAIEGIYSNDAGARLWYTTVAPNSLYYLSGFYEFSYLWDRPDQQYFLYGAYNFANYVRVIEIVTSTEIMPIYAEVAMYRIGVFSSFFGPLWVDFGWVSPIIMVIFGFAASRLADISRYQKPHWRPTYFLLATTVLYFPVLNVLTFGQGIFMITTFVIYGILIEVSQRPALRRGRDEPWRAQAVSG